MQSRIEKKTKEYAEQLALQIFRAKDSTFSKWPEIKASYEEYKAQQ